MEMSAARVLEVVGRSLRLEDFRLMVGRLNSVL